MFIHQPFANSAMIASLLLTLSLLLVFVASRSLLRRREERLSVRTPTRVANQHRLNQ